MSVEVRPATPDRWADVAAVFSGPRAENACWCQRFRHHDAPNNRAALEREITTAPEPVGLVAYVGADPVGWTRVVPRHTLPGVVGNRSLRRLLDGDAHGPDEAWWVSCFAVRRSHRGLGVGEALLRAATPFAAAHGAVVLDGHPVDVPPSVAASPTALFTGTRAMFVAAGFDELGRTYATRPVMRRILA